MNDTRFDIVLDVMRKVVAGQGKVEFNMLFFFHEQPRCGTSACALGQTALDPRAQAEGLYIWENEVRYRDSLNFNAAREWLSLGFDETIMLFGGDKRTAQQELEILEAFKNQGYDAASILADMYATVARQAEKQEYYEPEY